MLLEGDGRQVRYVTVHAALDIQRVAVVELLREAAAFAPPVRTRKSARDNATT